MKIVLRASDDDAFIRRQAMTRQRELFVLVDDFFLHYSTRLELDSTFQLSPFFF